MKKAINISIQKPCSENFNDFDKTAAGGFCKSCSKEVIDFTKKSDKEILAYFKTKNENTCGHFYKNQLKTYTEPRDKKQLRKHYFVSTISFSIVSLFFNQIAVSQETNPKKIVQTTNNKKLIKKSNAMNIIKGIVHSETDKYPLPGVSVVLKNSVNGTTTDFDGNFALQNIKEGDVLSVHYFGYKTQEVTIQKQQRFIKIVMEEEDAFLGGFVLAGKVDVKKKYKTKRSLWQRIKSIF